MSALGWFSATAESNGPKALGTCGAFWLRAVQKARREIPRGLLDVDSGCAIEPYYTATGSAVFFDPRASRTASSCSRTAGSFFRKK